MATSLADYLDEVDLQWKEVDILAAEALKVESEKPELYNALCRSITILIVAHMEGFVKGVAKNIIRDYGTLEFKMLPDAIKITYCKRHLGFDEGAFNNYHERIKNLVADFELSKDFKVSHDPFLNEKNRNPKPDVIKDFASKFGVSDIFKNLHNSRFDGVFDKTNAEIKKSLPYLNSIAKKNLDVFPYCVRKNIYKTKPSKYKGRTMWQSFLDDLNNQRHKIVHGNNFDNPTDISTLLSLKDKVRVLQYAFLLIICSSLCN